MFQSLFSKKKPPLTGAPAVRRLKTYSAQSGYVYQYYYEGHRESGSAAEAAGEFVFRISADRKTWHPASVLVSHEATRGWAAAQGRELSSTECYAIAKMALFQAFDERPDPSDMKSDVRVRRTDVDAIVDTLGL